MEHVSDEGLRTEAMMVRPAGRHSAASDRRFEPSAARIGAVFVGTATVLAVLVGSARLLAPIAGTAGGLVASVAAAVAATLLAASIVEWVVHRWIMHRPSHLPLLRLAYEHHHRAHHWINFPPDQYIQTGPVQYVPLWTTRLDRAATGRLAWGMTIAAHFIFYGVFAIALVVLPAWVLSGNTAFGWSVTVTSVVVLFLFIHAHDAMHYPGLSPVERLRSFKWLDHHHYIHHIDTGANTNFLLPLGDLLLGTLRRELTLEELRRWPSYEEARRTLVTPAFAADGTRLQGSVRSV
jgi:hypothetical protein